ncbi:hypothetical protein IJJ12_00445 [bacterium]|nr:hypothetical protein [bacterium]
MLLLHGRAVFGDRRGGKTVDTSNKTLVNQVLPGMVGFICLMWGIGICSGPSSISAATIPTGYMAFGKYVKVGSSDYVSGHELACAPGDDFCGDNTEWDETTGTCVGTGTSTCLEGDLADPYGCLTCISGYAYNNVYDSCALKCGANSTSTSVTACTCNDFYQTSAGTTSYSNTGGSCSVCPSGYEVSATLGTCVLACGSNSSNSSVTTCACDGGWYTSSGTTSYTTVGGECNTQALPCGANSTNNVSNSLQCVCNSGYYADSSGATSYTNYGGSCSYQKCTGSNTTGTYVSNGTCTCSSGFYSNTSGGTTVSGVTAACSYKKCGTGTTGTYVAASNGTCTCSSGKYSNSNSATTVGIATGTCTYNKYCTGTNVTVKYATSQPTCACKSGYYYNDSCSTTPTNTGSCNNSVQYTASGGSTKCTTASACKSTLGGFCWDTLDSNTYTWANRANGCDSGYSVPTRDQFYTLLSKAGSGNQIYSSWGLSSDRYFWSATGYDSSYAYRLYVGSSNAGVNYFDKASSSYVRCIKN